MADAKKDGRTSRCPVCDAPGAEGIGREGHRRAAILLQPKTGELKRRERALRIRMQNSTAGL